MPTCDDKGNIVGSNNYQGRMIIRFDADGKKYLYDIIDIKKKRSTPLKLMLYGKNHISLDKE